MKIVHAASELYPYMKTGGLADAVGALVTTFADRGHEVSAFLPGYRDALAHPAAAGAVSCGPENSSKYPLRPRGIIDQQWAAAPANDQVKRPR